MKSKYVDKYENVIIRNHQEIGISDYGLDYMVGLEHEIERLNNIINKLKWKPIEEYDKGNYDWVLVKYFDGDYECVPCVAEKRFDKWYNRNDEVIESDVKYFIDMQQIDKLQELKGSDK